MLNYYFSGTPGYNDTVMKDLAPDTPCRLLSCHGDYVKYGRRWLGHVLNGTDPKQNYILLDSGAFTAWNQGHPMHLEDLLPVYYEFMSKYWKDVKEIYLINLDKIPGSPGRTAESAEIQEAIEVSDQNYEILKREFGDRVLPVYHQGEPEERLYAVEAMTDYICVSPRNDLGEVHRVKWSREVHSKLKPTTRTHGLAATGLKMMTTVPWHSVDSATYVFLAATGMLILCINGVMVTIGVSSQSPLRHERGQHITTLDPFSFKLFEDRLKWLGHTVEEVATDHILRLLINIREIQYWVDNHHKFEIETVQTLFEL